MRVAVLSDIHGNWFALKSVLDDAKKEGVESIWCLGDVVGYGAQALECYRELINLEAEAGIPVEAWIAGNHDWGLGGKIPLEFPYFNEESAWVLQQMGLLIPSEEMESLRRFLAARPTFQESPRPGIWLLHGRVGDTDEGPPIDDLRNVVTEQSYIRDRPEDAWKAERAWGVLGRPWMILAGHTHQAMLWHRHPDGRWQSLLEPSPPGGSLRPPSGWPKGCPKCGEDGPCRSRRVWGQGILLPEDPVLINPGSVGQPRDGCPAAAYVILDLGEEGNQVTFRRVGYNVEATIYNLAQLVRTPDGREDVGALERYLSYVSRLRKALSKGEW